MENLVMTKTKIQKNNILLLSNPNAYFTKYNNLVITNRGYKEQNFLS